MKRVSLRLAVAFAVVVLAGAERPGSPLRDGDLIFHRSTSSQSDAIRRATGSVYTHVGMVFFRDGKPQVLEAVGPVEYTPIEAWIARGRDGHYVVRRLASVALDAERARRLRSAAEVYLGRPYDFYFEWSADRIYCSELVWKAYHEGLGIDVAPLQHLGDFHLSDPVVAAKLRERFGAKVPRDEAVISPGAIFEAPGWITVEER